MENNRPDGREPAVTVAIYARDAQGDPSSIDAQMRACKSYAERMGWRIDDTLIFTDAGVSGVTSTARPGLTALLGAAHSKPRAFTTLLTADSSRLGRCFADVLNILDQLKFQGVSVTFVEQGLDSSTNPEYFRGWLCGYATSDEAFIEKLRHAVRRGAKAHVEKGFIHGSRRFGYDHTPVIDPARMTGRRPSRLGVKLTVNPAEAAVVRRIFDLRGSGLSFRRIANLLNANNWPTGSNIRKWTASTVLAAVNNPIYRGRIVFGRTRSHRHPRTGKIRIEHLPPAEWMVREFPELRIVSDELWRKAQDRDEDRRAG